MTNYELFSHVYFATPTIPAVAYNFTHSLNLVFGSKSGFFAQRRTLLSQVTALQCCRVILFWQNKCRIRDCDFGLAPGRSTFQNEARLKHWVVTRLAVLLHGRC